MWVKLFIDPRHWGTGKIEKGKTPTELPKKGHWRVRIEGGQLSSKGPQQRRGVCACHGIFMRKSILAPATSATYAQHRFGHNVALSNHQSGRKLDAKFSRAFCCPRRCPQAFFWEGKSRCKNRLTRPPDFNASPLASCNQNHRWPVQRRSS